ncbi:flagella cluster protein [Halobacteriales archaeon QS_4_69_31]|nr:MAG: flagella cluster protein [Halobacteriales archaeon QS_4_69_31]
MSSPRLKLLREDRETTHLANREGLRCPACGEAFDRLFVSERRTNSFGDPDGPFCLARTDGKLVVLTH